MCTILYVRFGALSFVLLHFDRRSKQSGIGCEESPLSDNLKKISSNLELDHRFDSFEYVLVMKPDSVICTTVKKKQSVCFAV